MKIRSILLALTLCASMLFANETPDSAHYDSGLRIQFPAELAGMKFAGVYEYDTPESGYSVRYTEDDLTKVDIYVYDSGLNNIPNGYDNHLVNKENSKLGTVLKIMQERGQYNQVELLGAGTRPEQGNIQFVWSQYQFKQPPEDEMKLSESFVTGFAGNFIKIRLTYEKESSQERPDLSTRVLEEIIGLLKEAGTLREGEDVAFAFEIDGSLPEQVSAPWLAYLLGRQVYINDHTDQYDLLPGIIPSEFEDELEGRKTIIETWQAFKEKDDQLKNQYLDDLGLIHNAGFMREYVWTYFKRASWSEPNDLKIEAFQNWEKEHLTNHEAESHGNIRVSIETSESETPAE